ncbi:hypothetical protein HDG34_003277 [Paraburkholderia sp. HC6.4b]|uniref:hypothetical protein n=1 Tax=unclassified Paraburkholderia TaxID=2615204 RepID=UPI001616751D|nr:MULTISPECIES: hypothetical protein [unclassified Paraburkholderia]MBB5409336.1 hypothetical protein [Paraburkholderia sp. HC6.4b]MBB5451064.1 hypothetical protein [Paraburkholderia sp. Kb1A]
MERRKPDGQYPSRIVLPTADLIRAFRRQLRGVTLSDAGFEEIVRQVLDVFLDWDGDGQKLAALPDIHRLTLPELEEDPAHTIHIRLINATQSFAHQFFERLMTYGLFRAGNPLTDLDYGFDCFLGDDIVLFHCPY